MFGGRSTFAVIYIYTFYLLLPPKKNSPECTVTYLDNMQTDHDTERIISGPKGSQRWDMESQEMDIEAAILGPEGHGLGLQPFTILHHPSSVPKIPLSHGVSHENSMQRCAWNRTSWPPVQPPHPATCMKSDKNSARRPKCGGNSSFLQAQLH